MVPKGASAGEPYQAVVTACVADPSGPAAMNVGIATDNFPVVQVIAPFEGTLMVLRPLRARIPMMEWASQAAAAVAAADVAAAVAALAVAAPMTIAVDCQVDFRVLANPMGTKSSRYDVRVPPQEAVMRSQWPRVVRQNPLFDMILTMLLNHRGLPKTGCLLG